MRWIPAIQLLAALLGGLVTLLGGVAAAAEPQFVRRRTFAEVPLTGRSLGGDSLG